MAHAEGSTQDLFVVFSPVPDTMLGLAFTVSLNPHNTPRGRVLFLFYRRGNRGPVRGSGPLATVTQPQSLLGPRGSPPACPVHAHRLHVPYVQRPSQSALPRLRLFPSTGGDGLLRAVLFIFAQKQLYWQQLPGQALHPRGGSWDGPEPQPGPQASRLPPTPGLLLQAGQGLPLSLRLLSPTPATN